MPASSSKSFDLSALSWPQIAKHLRGDQRLIVPVGACDQFGPHLPIGTSTLISDALARDLSQEYGVLRAPALPYGVNVPASPPRPGTGSLREKTLHRALNDLLAAWYSSGFKEFILITAQEYDPHVEAVAGVLVTGARIRVVEALGIKLGHFLDGPSGPQHGGELDTSLMLFLYPELVRMETARDRPLEEADAAASPGELPEVDADDPGSVGFPTLASAEKGGRIYAYILQKIRDKVFSPGVPEP
jgi:creatinine amidohydrolase